MLEDGFQTTIWTQIQKAKQKDTLELNNLISKYRPPVVKYLTKKGFSSDAADDLAQEVFLSIMKDNILQRADSSKGKFRSLILGVTDTVMLRVRRDQGRLKRGGDKVILSLDDGPDLDHIITADQKQEDFDRLWMLNILEIALQRLKEEGKSRGTFYYPVLEMYIRHGATQKEIADTINKTVHDVKNYLYRAKLRLIELVKDEINLYSSSAEESESEVKYLTKFMDPVRASSNGMDEKW